MCVGVCLLGYLFVCLCGIRACMNEWVSDVRKWSMSIAHSSNSSSVWFAWPSIKQYPHRHLLSHTERVETHSRARTNPSTNTQSTPHLIYVITLLRSSTIFHFECVWNSILRHWSHHHHHDIMMMKQAPAAYTLCSVLLQIPAQMSHMIYSDREWKTHMFAFHQDFSLSLLSNGTEYGRLKESTTKATSTKEKREKEMWKSDRDQKIENVTFWCLKWKTKKRSNDKISVNRRSTRNRPYSGAHFKSRIAWNVI